MTPEEKCVTEELLVGCSPTVQRIINAHNQFTILPPSDEKESDEEDSNGEEDGDEMTEEYMGTRGDQNEQESNDSELTDCQQITITAYIIDEYDSGISMGSQPHPNNIRNVSVYHQYC